MRPVQELTRRSPQRPARGEHLTGVCSRCKYAFCLLCRHGSHGVSPCLPKDLANILKRYRFGSDEDRADLAAQYVLTAFAHGRPRPGLIALPACSGCGRVRPLDLLVTDTARPSSIARCKRPTVRSG